MVMDKSNDEFYHCNNSISSSYKDEEGSNNSPHEDEDEGFEGTGGASKDDPKNMTVTTAEKIVQREARFVRSLRLGLLLVLLTASAVSSALVYWRLVTVEQADFEAAFDDYSTKLTNEFQRVADRCLGTIGAFSNSITSNTEAANVTWPFVTIPNYEAQAHHVIELAKIPSLLFAPIVAGNERKKWEEVFVPQNINVWVKQSLMNKQSFVDGQVNETTLSYEAKPMQVNGTQVTPGFSPTMLAAKISPDDGTLFFDVSTSAGPYLPYWQTAPFLPGVDDFFVNLDMNTDSTFDGNIIGTLMRRKASLGRYTKNGYGDLNDGGPTSGFYYPVLTHLAQNSTVGGAIITPIFWIPFFSNVLPPNANGMIGVLGNTCNQSFTFRVDGATSTFVGDGDLHDPKYNHFKKEVSFLSLINDSLDDREYLGFPIDDTGCRYSLYIYPSNDLQSIYASNTPIVASMVILLVFIATSCLFMLYDRLLERRQRLVQKEAESSGAIVSSLFPAAYRERLIAAQLASNTTVAEDSINLDVPIADMYPACTVLFADLAGFTQWSSTREPVKVFCLLQEVFAAMDKVAKKFHVFKVETIGDCYMAVTGLPNAQSNHAQLMVRFASECLIRMRQVIIHLMETLGDDTASLSLRIGLHSGPVMAGILRGEKSRFQLFGDTVNTASRMESTGEKNRIQASNATADILRHAGKGHWLQPREDLVDAKGKGKLQTYWLVTDHGQSTAGKNSIPTNEAEDDYPTVQDATATNRVLIGELYNV